MNKQRVGIIGVGLIGGSLALALKQAGGYEIVACDPSAPRSLIEGFIDCVVDSPLTLAEQCDIAVLATPAAAAQSLLTEIAPACSGEMVITDVGSTKQTFIRAAQSTLGRECLAHLVPGHPIAGSEKSSAAAATANQFRGRKVVLTPLDSTAPQALAVVTRLWQQAGAEVVLMDAAKHDALLAAISHLPHLLAYALVGGLLASSHREDAVMYAAGGLRDFTRIASSDPVMWRDICLTNREYLLQAVNEFENEFRELRDMIARRDGDALTAFFRRVSEYRSRF